MTKEPLIEINFRQDPRVFSTIKDIKGCQIDRDTMIKLTEMQMEFEEMVDQLNDGGLDINLSVYYWDIVVHALGYEESFCLIDFIAGMNIECPSPEQVLTAAENTMVTH